MTSQQPTTNANPEAPSTLQPLAAPAPQRRPRPAPGGSRHARGPGGLRGVGRDGAGPERAKSRERREAQWLLLSRGSVSFVVRIPGS